ncbi:MAG TPA: low molecular weight protein-tyrosine-phosphatase [Steroidobacteraceae bacterium]|nr:low molecular weight protein-tyrosine-phosphatase [Steroidobacteraceae bacterium]
MSRPSEPRTSMSPAAPPLRILFVCAGNICRSPTAEALFRAQAQRYAPQLQVEVDSAGTLGFHIGEAPDDRAQRVARARGLDLSGLRARLLTAEDFESFDWIIVMDRRNRAAVRRLAPRKYRSRVRLLMEFAPHLGVAELPDPYCGEHSDFERAFDLAEQATRGLLRALTGA